MAVKPGTLRSRAGRLWVGAAALPAILYAIVALAQTPGAGWSTRVSGPAVSTDALLLSAVLIIIGVPPAAVALASHCRTAGNPTPGTPLMMWREAMTLLGTGIAVFVFTSAALGFAALGVSIATMELIAATHCTLGAAAVALGGIGAISAAMFRNPLDAAAVSTAVSLVAGTGILMAGPVVSDLPLPFVESALAASPLVATASAARVDLLRTSVLYHVSPIAHTQFDYPTWQAAAGLYLLVALASFGGVARAVRRPTTGPTD